MKKLIFILIFGIFLVSFVGAEECQLAIPRYGVVQCMNTGQRMTDLSQTFSCIEGEWCSSEISCLSNCQLIGSISWGGNCPFGYTKNYEILLGSTNLGEASNVPWDVNNKLTVNAICKMPIVGLLEPVPEGTKVLYQEDKIMLYEGWAGSLPNTPISGTENCILNKDINEEQNIDSYLDPSTETIENKEGSTYSSLDQFPYNWKINDHYIFVKDWQTNIADISLTYDKENNAYWCGGLYGSRKIYDVQEIISQSGQCYAIPQSVHLSGVECCFPADCIDTFGAEYTCNPDNWKCEKTKPCNSQLECDSVFGEGICQNNQINQWVCDLTKKWGDYAGTCVHSSKQVSECPSDCSNKEYYNEEQGKCLLRTRLEEETNDSKITGTVIGKSSTGTIILIVFLVLIGGSIAYYFYTNKKKTTPKKGVKKELKTKGKHCTKCGSLLKPRGKFCSECGRKV